MIDNGLLPRNSGKGIRVASLAMLLLLSALPWAHGASFPLGQSEQKLALESGDQASLNYLLFLPNEYRLDAARRWPLIIFLHGSDERGDDPELVKGNGIPAILEDGKNLPFIVVSPQCPTDLRWSPEVVHELYQAVSLRLRVDPDRVYLTGYSMGGYGTWDTAEEYPELFAAIVPIAGGGDVQKAARLRKIPIWAFHGAKDENVPPDESIQMADAVKKSGGNVRLTIYPELEHDSWTVTYNNPDLYDWLLMHKRGSPEGPMAVLTAIGRKVRLGAQFLKNTILVPF